MAAVMEKQPVVESADIVAQQTLTDTKQQTEQNLNTEVKCRFALSKTVILRPTVSLTGTCTTL